MADMAGRRLLREALGDGQVPRLPRTPVLGRRLRLVATASIVFMLSGCTSGEGTPNGDEAVISEALQGDATDKGSVGPTKERPIAGSGSAVVIRHDSNVPPGILDSIEETVAYARREFGDSGSVVVHVYSTSETFIAAHEPRAQEQARKDIEGGAFALAGSGVIWIYTPTYAKSGTNSRRLTLLHEYFHTVQDSLSGPRRSQVPLWLVEGSARYFELRTGADRGYTYFDRERENEIAKSKALGPLAKYETEGASTARGGRGEAYTLGFVASDFLVQTKGVDTLKRYFWTLLASTPDWQTAFSKAFGTSVEDFYVAFEANRPKS